MNVVGKDGALPPGFLGLYVDRALQDAGTSYTVLPLPWIGQACRLVTCLPMCLVARISKDILYGHLLRECDARYGPLTVI